MKGIRNAAITALLMMVSHTVTAWHQPASKSLPSHMLVWGQVCPPVRVSGPDPDFPSDAEVQGIVILEVWIRKDGTVASVNVLKPLPFGISEAAAIAVRAWQYSPGTIGGVAVPVVHTEVVHYRRQKVTN